MDQEIINGWHNLESFGIISLTGEACGLGLRQLCDLTPKGADLVSDFLGGNVKFTEGSNWNQSGAITSVMLPRGILQDLAIFCLLRKYPVAAITKFGQVIGMDDETLTSYKSDAAWMEANILRVHSKAGTARAGFRNKHEMTGRVE